MRAGLGVGHYLTSLRGGFNSSITIERWNYAFGENFVSTPKNLIEITQNEISGSKIIIPKIVTTLPALDGPSYMVMGLTKIVAIRQSFSLAGPKTFTVSTWDRPSTPGVQAMQAAMAAQQRFPCPDPTSQAGCDALFFEKAKPVIDEIVNFIKTTAPLVENEIAIANK